MDGVDGKFAIAGGDGRNDVGFGGLASTLGVIAAVEWCIRRNNLEVDGVALEVGKHCLSDDVVRDVVSEIDGELWEFVGVFFMEGFVGLDEVGVGWVCWHGDDVDKMETRNSGDENTVRFG